MRIKNIENVGYHPVYDISVQDVEHYILENGVVTHNTGGMYSANQVFIIGKAQEKDGTELTGYNFTINIEKSRFVKEKSKFPFLVKFNEGISIWSGLMDIALDSGHVIKPKVGWYQKIVDFTTGEYGDKSYRAKDTENEAFWGPILADQKFKDFVEKRYTLGASTLFDEDDMDEVLETLEDEDENLESE